jgi:small subunit ribosomal protein S16
VTAVSSRRSAPTTRLDAEAATPWRAVGAQPTDRLVRIFANLGLVAAPVRPEQTKKSQPKARAQERAKAAAEKAAAAAEEPAAE